MQATKDDFWRIKRGHGYLIAITGSMWLLWVYVPLFLTEIALRHSYTTDLLEGMIVALDLKYSIIVQNQNMMSISDDKIWCGQMEKWIMH